MIEEYTKQINKLLEKINEESKENASDLINLATSTEYNIGGVLCRYGELYNLVLNSESFDEILQQLDKLFYLAKFEMYEEEIAKLQEWTFNFIKGGCNFLVGRETLLTKIKEEYILNTITSKL